MSFVYPIALLGLLAIPVLILIYIIKNRYTEQTISSTYIWNLSEKFLKRRVPISKVAGILSLILQLLIVAFISLAMAHPIIIAHGGADSYCFVLDASGSMNFIEGGHARFDLAKNAIEELIDSSMDGSDYTLIYAGTTAETVFENVTDKKSAKLMLEDLNAGFVPVDPADAAAIAQAYFDENPATRIYLLTDADYESVENVELIKLSTLAENYALTDVTYGLLEAQLRIGGTAISYGEDKTLTVALTFGDEEEPTATQTVQASSEGTPFEFICDRTGFASFKVAILEEDALPYDNEVIIFDVNYENISEVLLVSESPFFIQAALAAAGVVNVDVRHADEYDKEATGYGLYIFDGFSPEILPDDGAVWFFNPQASVTGAGFTYQTEIDMPKLVAGYSDSTATLVNTLLEGVTKNSFALKKYIKCGIGAKFTTLISCDGNPLLFVGNNSYGNREAVFAFDVHDSAAFTLMGDFSTIVKNLIDYSFPTVIDSTFYYGGDTVLVNVIAGCKDIRIGTPSGKTAYLEASFDVCEYQLGEVGVYDIILYMKDGSERRINIYSAMPEGERIPVATEASFSVMGAPDVSEQDGYFDILLYLFIALCALAVADFGVYCYEQYQLR